MLVLRALSAFLTNGGPLRRLARYTNTSGRAMEPMTHCRSPSQISRRYDLTAMDTILSRQFCYGLATV